MHPPTVRFQIAIWGLPLIIPGWFHVNLFTMLLVLSPEWWDFPDPRGWTNLQGLKKIPRLTSCSAVQLADNNRRTHEQACSQGSGQVKTKVRGLLCFLLWSLNTTSSLLIFLTVDFCYVLSNQQNNVDLLCVYIWNSKREFRITTNIGHITIIYCKPAVISGWIFRPYLHYTER